MERASQNNFLKLPTQRLSSLPGGPRPGSIEHLNIFYFLYITSRNINSLHCFLAHTERAQHISAEDGLHCPLQIRHLDLDLDKKYQKLNWKQNCGSTVLYMIKSFTADWLKR